MNNVEYLNQKINVPSSWDELTASQFFLLAKLLFVSMDHTRLKSLMAIDALNLNGKLFSFAGKIFLVPGWVRKFKIFAFRYIARKKAFQIHPEEIFFVSELYNFLFIEHKEKNMETVMIRNSHLTINHFPSIKCKSQNLIGPSKYMGDSTIAEFITAEMHYQQFISTTKVEDLNLLCASLFRPVDKPNKHYNPRPKRINFDDDYNVIAPLFDHIVLWKRFAILIFFEGVRNNLMIDYPEAFAKSINNNQDDTQDNDNGWPKIISSLAGHVSKIDTVLAINMHTFFFDINLKIYQNRTKPTKA